MIFDKGRSNVVYGTYSNAVIPNPERGFQKFSAGRTTDIASSGAVLNIS